VDGPASFSYTADIEATGGFARLSKPPA